MSEIIPALLPQNSEELKKSLSELPPEARFVHLDVLETDVWAPIDREFEVHLMVREPEKIIDKWIERGARRVIVHESSPEILKYRAKVEIGLEIEMQEFLAKELEQVPSVDFVHIMSIDEIGEQGHPFDPKVFDRIKKVKEKFPQIAISVDGGINAMNYQELEDLGVERLVVGSGFQELWKLLMRN